MTRHLDTSRLTGADLDAIAAAIRGHLRAWPYDPHTPDDLTRVGLRAIGCTEIDMRASELEMVDQMARFILDDHHPPRSTA
jgi:hypothetical protein